MELTLAVQLQVHTMQLHQETMMLLLLIHRDALQHH